MTNHLLYSNHRETSEAQLSDCDSVTKQWPNDKEISSMPEAVEEVTRIVNAFVQCMFETVQRVKLDYPNFSEAHILYEYIAYTTVDWMFMSR